MSLNLHKNAIAALRMIQKYIPHPNWKCDDTCSSTKGALVHYSNNNYCVHNTYYMSQSVIWRDIS